MKVSRLALPLLPLALLACQDMPPAAEATAILTERTQPGGSEIVKVAPDGSATILWNDPGDAQQPKWAARSERVVFVSTRDGNPEIYRMGISGQGQERLTDNPAQDLHPAWSPDARDVVFSSDRDGDMDLYRMDSGGEDESISQLTTDPAADAEADWFGDVIAFTSNRAGDWEIFTIGENGGTETRLTQRPDWDDVDPVWSPDGTLIAFESRSRLGGGNDSNLLVMNADGSGLRELTTIPDDHEIDPSWSPDGEMIVYSAFNELNSNLDLFVVDVQTGAITVRVAESYDDRHAAWTTVP
jgi:TolB protein